MEWERALHPPPSYAPRLQRLVVTVRFVVLHVARDVIIAPAVFVPPVGGGESLPIWFPAVAGRRHIGLPEIALDAVNQEDAADILDHDAFGFLVHGDAFRRIAGEGIGFANQVVEFFVSPGVAARGDPNAHHVSGIQVVHSVRNATELQRGRAFQQATHIILEFEVVDCYLDAQALAD